MTSTKEKGLDSQDMNSKANAICTCNVKISGQTLQYVREEEVSCRIQFIADADPVYAQFAANTASKQPSILSSSVPNIMINP
jgi:hypothetical protein